MSIPENHRREGVKDGDLVNEELPTEKSLRGALKYRKKSAFFQSESNPGIDSWVPQDEPSKQVTQISWVLEPNLPSLADFIKTNKNPVFAGFARFAAKATKPLE